MVVAFSTTIVYNHLHQSIMERTSITYDLKWQLKHLPYYKWTVCGKLINMRTGRRIKKTLNGGSVGYWIASKFYTLKSLRGQLEKIPKNNCPF